MTLKIKRAKEGFTLVELIIVIAIIAILAGAIFVAIDPARRLHEARNARRASDVSTILDAVKKYQADNEGTHYINIVNMTVSSYYGVGTDGKSCSACTPVGGVTSCISLASIGNNYMALVPTDPLDGTEGNTKYYILKGTDGSITVGSCTAEGEGPGGAGTPPEINITR